MQARLRSPAPHSPTEVRSRRSAGKGVGDNVSPALRWTGVPAEAKQLVLIMDDLDVPMPKPLIHTIAVIDPHLGGLAEGELKPGTTGVRLMKAFGDTYVGPRPIPGHGPHHYRFLVFALSVAGPRQRRRPRGLTVCDRRPRAGARCADGHVRTLTWCQASRVNPRGFRARSRPTRCGPTCPTAPASHRAETAIRRATPSVRSASPSA
jgi:phosphatidylethanolamine-binding protein (PEBP) family uncharacterized protein